MSQQKTLCRTRWPSCTRFHKKLSRNVSRNGRTAGRSVCITKETTLQGIRFSDVKINNCIFADLRSDTFCTAHVCYVISQIYFFAPSLKTLQKLSSLCFHLCRNSKNYKQLFFSMDTSFCTFIYSCFVYPKYKQYFLICTKIIVISKVHLEVM